MDANGSGSVRKWQVSIQVSTRNLLHGSGSSFDSEVPEPNGCVPLLRFRGPPSCRRGSQEGG